MCSSHALDTLNATHILFSIKRSWTSNTATTTSDHTKSFKERVNPLGTRYQPKISQYHPGTSSVVVATAAEIVKRSV